MKNINIKQLAGLLAAYQNCIKANNVEWIEKHYQSIKDILTALPSGSGIDAGVIFDFEKSTPEKLIFTFGFHFMDDNGMYDGWKHYTLTVTPSLQFMYQLTLKGENKRNIKEYLFSIFDDVFFTNDVVNA